MRPISVSELSSYLHSILTSDPILRKLAVRGEVVNLSRRKHLYFDLKDDKALVHCIYFDEGDYAIENGDEITVEGGIITYSPAGRYQVRVSALSHMGKGEALSKLEKLRKKLFSEGLFSAERKKALVRYPQTIALVTSSKGAAVHDFLNVLRERYPLAVVWVADSPVQGQDAPRLLSRALTHMDAKEPDVLVLTRGGGSDEDLSVFNDERLVRTVASVNTPIISAVGHEVDLTLCDLACDVRASTPTAAAVLVSPDISELLGELRANRRNLEKLMQFDLSRRSRKVLTVKMRLSELAPIKRLHEMEKKIQKASFATEYAIQKRLSEAEGNLSRLRERMNSLYEKRLIVSAWHLFGKDGEEITKDAKVLVGGTYILASSDFRYEVSVTGKEKKNADI